MAARRERTTGLPRQRRRENRPAHRGEGRFSERSTRIAILGGISALLLVVIALLGWRWYDQEYRLPEKTVLQVGDEKFKLKYYADRLLPFAQSLSDAGVSLGIAEQQLLAELEAEALVKLLATEKGITVSAEEVTAEIAAQLGVPAGGAGTSFDTLYRQKLESTSMSDGNYRRQVEAEVYRQKLLDAYALEMGETGEMVTLRTIVTASEDEAKAALARIEAGEDMGTVAQTVSSDLESRQKDGLMEPEPPRLLPEAVQTAIEGREAGDEVVGPVELSTGDWWLLRVEKRDPEATPSATQKSQLAELQLADEIDAKRSQVTIERDMSADDFSWAEDNAD